MLNSVDFYYGDGSLYEDWCTDGNPLLDIGIVCCHRGEILRIRTPRIDDYNLKSAPEADDSAELCLIYRDSGMLYKKIGKVLDLKETLYQIGYGKEMLSQNNSISIELLNHNNDYSLYEDIYKLFGLEDAVYGNAPQLRRYPFITVIIPGYKVEDTIDEVIEYFSEGFRVCNADKWEIVVVDDACEKEIKINRQNVRVIRSDKKVYCGGARNIGINNTQGSIVVFCDGDTCIASNYIMENVFRQMIAPNIITVCMRENIERGTKIPDRRPIISQDTRYYTVYHPDRIGSTIVEKDTVVMALNETDNFREFGYGKKLGPADLPFMVKGNNICVSRSMAGVLFPPDFIGYGPEDVTYSAKLIARGCKVIPVLSSGVFHRKHEVRSDSNEARDEELRRNIIKQLKCLQEKTWEKWNHE